MNKGQTLASPNRMVWELFEALRRLCFRVIEAKALDNDAATRQDAAICIILSVQCVEVFLNVYFRVLISEPAFSHAANRISADLNKANFGLDKKIKQWPEVVFGEKLNLNEGAGKKFVDLKNLRNELMHFKSSHETISIPGISIKGVADISAYKAITADSAGEALGVAEDFLCEVFKLRGVAIENLPHSLHAWTGKVPVMSKRRMG